MVVLGNGFASRATMFLLAESCIFGDDRPFELFRLERAKLSGYGPLLRSDPRGAGRALDVGRIRTAVDERCLAAAGAVNSAVNESAYK